MPDANDDVLLALAPGLSRPQVIEIRIKSPLDGDYELQVGDPLVYDPVVFTAAANTAEEIRDALAEQIVSPAFDPFVAWKVLSDRFRVKGSPGDPFDYALASPSGQTSATAKVIQAAQGATTAMRTIYLTLAIKLIDPVVYRDVTQEAQAWLAAWFCEKALVAIGNMDSISGNGGQQASSMSLAVASVSYTSMPSAEELSGSALYGQPLALLMDARKYGPTWS